MGDITTSSTLTSTPAERGRGRRPGFRGGRGRGARSLVNSETSTSESLLQDTLSAGGSLSHSQQPNSDNLNTLGRLSQPRNYHQYRQQRGRGIVNDNRNADSGTSVREASPLSSENPLQQVQSVNRGRGRRGTRGFSNIQANQGGVFFNRTAPNVSFNPNAAPFIPGVGFVSDVDAQCANAPFSQQNTYNRRRQRQSARDGQTRRERGGSEQQGPREHTNGDRKQQNNSLHNGIPGVYPTRGKYGGQSFRKPVRPHPRRKQLNEDDQELSLRDRLIQQLEDDCYECAICCQVIQARQGIWSCKICYHMFHISGGCVINWAKKSKEEDNKWRCPTCQTKYEAVPYNYFCFCRKERNPTLRLGDTPHSCGNVCGGQRAPGCPHPCNEPCHPGPCPECPVMLTRQCNCGAIQKAIRCGSVVEVKCDKVCDRLLTCGEHRCDRICHEGDCNKCEVIVKQDCFCGLSSREIACFERHGIEHYSCGAPCKGLYSCGKHQCTRNCHITSEFGCGPCPSAPERITRCPCGKCTLDELRVQRVSCQDPIPTCKNVCGKVLPCGSAEKRHRCRALCHTGDCPSCELNTSIICRCKQVKRTLPCTEYVQFVAEGSEFLCERRCKKRKSCGIHKCQEVCCVQTEHFCMQICNKRLSCGLHFCESICHAGQCPRCLNTSFEEQYCHCGRTMRPPPIPCGAPLPECDQPCARPHTCNHPVTHRCHGEEHCPPCTALVERMCYGGHELRKNIPCHIQAVSCGRICDKSLICGVHNCNRSCHADDCLRQGEKCTRPCMVLRRPCEHPCALPCHGTTPCPDSECVQIVIVTCECGKRKSQIKCSEFEKMIGRLRAFENEDSEGGHTAESGVGALKRSASMEKLNCLPCDDDCKKIARNKRLAEALELVTDENGELEREPTITYSEYVKGELRTNSTFVQEIETNFLELLEKLGDPTYLGVTLSHNFRPMSVDKRRFVHEYAAFFFIETIGVDEPPKRSVIATARRGISRPPLVLLTSLQKYPSVLKARGPSTLRSIINDDTKRGESNADETTRSTSMKTLRGIRNFKQRVAPQLTRPPPLPQFNPFAALCSDDEQEEIKKPSQSLAQPIIFLQEKDPDWWSDEEDQMDTTDDIVIAELMRDLLHQVCRELSTEMSTSFEDCKNSWSDDD